MLIFPILAVVLKTTLACGEPDSAYPQGSFAVLSTNESIVVLVDSPIYYENNTFDVCDGDSYDELPK